MDVYLALVGVASLSIAVIFFRNQLDRGRSRSLEQEAQRLGFSFAAVAAPIEESAINEVASCMQESGCIDSEVIEVMQGTILGRRVLVFNLREYSSLGDGSTVTTVAAFQCSATRFPVFQLRAKDVIDLCRDRLRDDAVDSDVDPEFGKRFQLCADDATKRKFFTSGRLGYLQRCVGHFEIRSSPNWLLIFHLGEEISAKNLRHFVQVTSTIAFGLLDPEIIPD